MATPYCPPVLGGRGRSPEGVYNLNKVAIYVTTLASYALSVFRPKTQIAKHLALLECLITKKHQIPIATIVTIVSIIPIISISIIVPLQNFRSSKAFQTFHKKQKKSSPPTKKKIGKAKLHRFSCYIISKIISNNLICIVTPFYSIFF